MKNFTVYTFLFALILAVNTITCPAYAEGRVLIYSDHEPLGNMRTTFLHEILFPNIAKESGGRLTIEEHWNSELSTGYDALNKTKTGEIDLAVIVPEYDSVNLPLHQLFKSFPIGPSGNEQADFFSFDISRHAGFKSRARKTKSRACLRGNGLPCGVLQYTSNPNDNQPRRQKMAVCEFLAQGSAEKCRSDSRHDSMGRAGIFCTARWSAGWFNGEYRQRF